MLQYKSGIWDWVYYILLGFTTKLQAMEPGVNKPLKGYLRQADENSMSGDLESLKVRAEDIEQWEEFCWEKERLNHKKGMESSWGECAEGMCMMLPWSTIKWIWFFVIFFVRFIARWYWLILYQVAAEGLGKNKFLGGFLPGNNVFLFYMY